MRGAWFAFSSAGEIGAQWVRQVGAGGSEAACVNGWGEWQRFAASAITGIFGRVRAPARDNGNRTLFFAVSKMRLGAEEQSVALRCKAG